MLFAQEQGSPGLPGYCAPPPPPRARLPASCSLRKEGKQPPARGGQSGCCQVGKAPTAAPLSLPPPGTPGGLPVPLICSPGTDPPRRGAAGQGLPHGGAGTIWEGGHVTSAGRERHVKGSARPYLVAEWLRRARLVALVPIPCQIPHPGGAVSWGGHPRDGFWGNMPSERIQFAPVAPVLHPPVLLLPFLLEAWGPAGLGASSRRDRDECDPRLIPPLLRSVAIPHLLPWLLTAFSSAASSFQPRQLWTRFSPRAVPFLLSFTGRERTAALQRSGCGGRGRRFIPVLPHPPGGGAGIPRPQPCLCRGVLRAEGMRTHSPGI